MTTYTVTQKIQSVNIDENAPVDVQYYKGDSHVQAIGAMVMAATSEDIRDPEYYTILSVSLTITKTE